MPHTTLWLRILDSKALLAAAESQQDASYIPFCEVGVSRTCDTDGLTRTTIDLLVAFVLVYFGVICCILVYKLKTFNGLPYSRAQAALVFYRFQARHPLIAGSNSQTTFSTCIVLFATYPGLHMTPSIICMTYFIHTPHSQNVPRYCLMTPGRHPEDSKCNLVD